MTTGQVQREVRQAARSQQEGVKERERANPKPSSNHPTAQLHFAHVPNKLSTLPGQGDKCSTLRQPGSSILSCTATSCHSSELQVAQSNSLFELDWIQRLSINTPNELIVNKRGGRSSHQAFSQTSCTFKRLDFSWGMSYGCRLHVVSENGLPDQWRIKSTDEQLAQKARDLDLPLG